MKILRNDFVDFTRGRIGDRHMCPVKKTKDALSAFEDKTGGDVIVLAVQSGIHHRGTTILDVRKQLPTKEFGLTAEMVAVLLLTNPERLVKDDDLAIDCTGSKYAPGAVGDFYYAPCWSVKKGKLRFSFGRLDFPAPRFGSATAFAPI